MAKRKLSSEDIEFWKKATVNTKPLNKIIIPSTKKKAVGVVKTPNVGLGALKEWSHSSFPKIAEALPKVEKSELLMDQKTFAKMTRGRMEPDAKIDLHGYTMAEAFAMLSKFIKRNYQFGHRLVLVITGKGNNRSLLPDEKPSTGILRNQVPKWLATPAFRNIILQVHMAHLRHGGSGALYVYLRRRKNV